MYSQQHLQVTRKAETEDLSLFGAEMRLLLEAKTDSELLIAYNWLPARPGGAMFGLFVVLRQGV